MCQLFAGSTPTQGLAAFHEGSTTNNAGAHRHQDNQPDTTTTITTTTDEQPVDKQQQGPSPDMVTKYTRAGEVERAAKEMR